MRERVGVRRACGLCALGMLLLANWLARRVSNQSLF